MANSKWIEGYARLAYGILTYKTVRSSAQGALSPPNVVACRLGETAVSISKPPRRADPATLTLAVSLGLPSPDPDVWRADVKRARGRWAPINFSS